MRKPGIILLTGSELSCENARAALDRLGPGFRCEVWTVPQASAKLREAVAEHDGECWECEWDPDDPLDPAGIETPHGLMSRPTWHDAVRAALEFPPC